jgi:protein phosphatase
MVCRKLIDRANARGGPDNITVVAVRFEGTALDASMSTDRVGYNAFPLSGSLNDHMREVQATPRTPRIAIKSDPTPRQGVRMPTRSEQREADEAQREIDAGKALAAPLPQPVIEERKRAVQPLYILLGALALAAVVWTAMQLTKP